MTGADITLTFLGTGSAIPPLNRQQSSMALRHGFGLVIFDCGEGTQYAMRRNKVPTKKELIVCLTHLHSDHFLGLPGLLASFELLNREDDVIIIGPKYTNQLVQNLLIANFVKTSYNIMVIELEPEEQFKGTGFSIQAVKAIHEANALSYIWREDNRLGKIDIKKIKELGVPDGPLIGKLQRGESVEIDGKIVTPTMVQGPERKGRIVCYSGDTSPNAKLAEKLANGCDILIHEATYPSDMIELAEERNHSTVSQAAQIAKDANVEKLILTHISPRINDFNQELRIGKSIFNPLEIAKDGVQFVLPYSSK